MTVVKIISCLVAEIKKCILYNGVKKKNLNQRSATNVFLFNGQKQVSLLYRSIRARM